MKWNKTALRIAFVSALLMTGVSSIPSSAYNISLKGRMHERMTVKAEQCLEAANGALPTRCDIGEPNDKLKGKWNSPLAKATRWSDDPTNQAGPLGAPKFAYNMLFGGCDQALQSEPGEARERYFAGLLCNSHYGAFQFMHAMSTNTDENS